MLLGNCARHSSAPAHKTEQEKQKKNPGDFLRRGEIHSWLTLVKSRDLRVCTRSNPGRSRGSGRIRKE
jgi:hypothetical protein